MAYIKRKLEELNIMDDFLMNAIATDEEVGVPFCREVPELEYDDGLYFIYFYTDGTKGGSPEIKAMLNYFKTSTQENVTTESTKRIHDYTSKVKIEPEVRDAYMTFEDKIYYERMDATATATHNTKVQSICELLEDYGPIPDELTTRLNNENDLSLLTKWLKLAAKVDSIDAFLAAINEQ